MGDSYQLRSVAVEVHSRGDYLHVVLRGDLSSADDMKQLTALLQHLIDKLAIRRLLVSARDFEHPPTKESWAILWTWLNERTCRQFGWVAPSATAELMITTMNLAAMADALAFRAFASAIEAAHWLERRSTVDRRAVADLGDEPSSSGRPMSSGRYSAVTESGPVPRRSDLRDAIPESWAESSRRRRSSTGLPAIRESDEPPRSARVDPRAEPADGEAEDDLPARPRGARK